MVKMKDVAAHLGISVSTVSRVLNKYDRVAPEMRKRVEDAIKELNYEPDEIAQRLKRNSSDVLGVIVPDITNPFFASVVRGIQRIADEKGFSVLLCDTNAQVKLEQKAVSLFSRQKVAGIISASVASPEEAKEIYNIDENIVFVDNAPSLDGYFSTVTINNYLAAKELVTLLLNRGYSNICTIAGPKNESSASDRLKGYIAALEEAHVTIPDKNIRCGNYDISSGIEQMKEFLGQRNKPDALFAANNFMAFGAMQVCLEAGLKVPEDIVIATFDINDYTGLVKDKFLSVVQPAFDIGYTAADICVGGIKQGGIKKCCKMILQHFIE